MFSVLHEGEGVYLPPVFAPAPAVGMPGPAHWVEAVGAPSQPPWMHTEACGLHTLCTPGLRTELSGHEGGNRAGSKFQGISVVMGSWA